MSDLERKRPDRWRRDQGAPFDDLKREDFAQARAKGGTVRASAQLAGCSYAVAIEWEKHPAMRARLRELRGNAETFIGVSVGYIIGELKRNVELARENGQLKSSNEALKIMYDIVTTNPDVQHRMARALPPSMTVKDIRKQLLASFGQDTASPPVGDTMPDNQAPIEVVDNGAET